jgi:hypothetical protein
MCDDCSGLAAAAGDAPVAGHGPSILLIAWHLLTDPDTRYQDLDHYTAASIRLPRSVATSSSGDTVV